MAYGRCPKATGVHDDDEFVVPEKSAPPYRIRALAAFLAIAEPISS
jgi:hypothetical protein